LGNFPPGTALESKILFFWPD